MTRAAILVLALLVMAQQAEGNPIFDWLRNIGIDYVAPSPRQGTCRDCSAREGRFGFDVTPTQPTAPCCTVDFKCGIEGSTDLGARIVGGVESTAGKYPWIAVYQDNDDYERTSSGPGGCAGTLVAAQWVVTAAHCLDGKDRNNLKMVLGEYDLSDDDDRYDNNRKEFYLALDPILHENYGSPYPNSNDIALLKLAVKADLNIYTPACLPRLDADYTLFTGSVYGWGSTASCPASPVDIMREVAVKIASDTTCEAASSASVTIYNAGRCTTVARDYDGKISEDMLCARAYGKDACQGDRGGPLTVKSATSQHVLVGVVSWGYGCAADGLYGVYSEVAKQRTWIDTTIAANGGATYTP